MKHLANAVAIAAAMVIAMPVLAVAQTSPSTTDTGKPSRTSGMPKAGTPSPSGHKAAMHHPIRRAPATSTADQLNAQELARVESGAPAMPMTSTGVPGQPSMTSGMPKAGTPSPSKPTP